MTNNKDYIQTKKFMKLVCQFMIDMYENFHFDTDASDFDELFALAYGLEEEVDDIGADE